MPTDTKAGDAACVPIPLIVRFDHTGKAVHSATITDGSQKGGRMFFVVLPELAPAPTREQVLSGIDGQNKQAFASSTPVVAGTPLHLHVAKLPLEQNYVVFSAHQP